MGDAKKQQLKAVADNAIPTYGEWFKEYLNIFTNRPMEWLLVFLFGYYNISVVWLVVPLLLCSLREKQAKDKMKCDSIRSIANAEGYILQEIQRLSNLPSWVMFPDKERVEWLNKIVRRLWPYASHYVHDLCKVSIEPSICKALKKYKLTEFCFKKIVLGDTPIRLSGVKVYDDTSRREIIMDMDFAYAGDCKFEVSLSRFKIGIEDVQISGKMRVMMKPLVRQIPLVGGLQVFFLNNPDVDFNFTGLGNVLDFPGLSDILRRILTDQIAKMMVLPNRIPIHLVKDISMAELKCPSPAGVLRIHVIEAENLMDEDSILSGKSDPYCILRLGGQKFQTQTIDNTFNPKWDYSCEFLVNEVHGQELDMTVFDVDGALNKADPLGRANLNVQYIWQSGKVDLWMPLSDAKSGRIHVKASWLELTKATDSLEAQLEEIEAQQTPTSNPLHSAVLIVWIDSAKNLCNTKDTFVRLHMGNTQQIATLRQNTNNPVFEEGFTFLVRNPHTQELKVEVVDNKTTNVQGNIKLNLNILLKERNLEIMNVEYPLSDASGGLATLRMNLSLRILKTVLKPNDGESRPKEIELAVGGGASGREGETLEGAKVVVTTVATPSLNQNVPEVGAHGLGRIELTMKYEPQKNLTIVVHRVLLPMGEDGKLPDPYVKLYLLPDRSEDSKRETDVVENDCCPRYDKTFEYTLPPNELTKHTLEVTVINKKDLQCLLKMGQVILDCGLLDSSQETQWYDLCPPCDNEDE